MNIDFYKRYLSTRGITLGQVKRTQSDVIINNTFTLDPNYKKVYVLTRDGWKWEDAKYQTHYAPTIAKDAVDYYLQFRPKVHYPVGSYVIVPDDKFPNTNLEGAEILNPFKQPIEKRTQWWIIVGRDESDAFVRYMILKCDWDFRWTYKDKLMSCWACSRTANSYTSGVWTDEYTKSLDNLSQCFLPDTYYVYGDKLEILGMCDTRTVMHGQRFFYTNNDLDPKIYQVTKITDLNPQGVIKLSIKQDELNRRRDNIELRICDYYTDGGDINVNILQDEDNHVGTSEITWLAVDESDELTVCEERKLDLGSMYYFEARFSELGIDPQWNIELSGDYSEEDKEYYVGLMKLTKFNDNILAIKTAKASSLKGKKFILTVSDLDGNYKSSIGLEVAE